ncbi:MAG: hypothetical protein ACLUPR_08990, partial [Dorea sp.]
MSQDELADKIMVTR